VLRVTGVLAVVLSSILTVLCFAGIRTVRASGRFYNTVNPHPQTLTTNWSELLLKTDGGTRNLFTGETAPAYPGGFGYVTNGDIVLTGFVFFPELPRECEVDIVHRWVGRGGKYFGSTVLVFDGTSHSMERSPMAFFTTLTLVSLAPTILWGIAALIGRLLPCAAGSAPHPE